jgi:hypothetical protein
LFNKVISRFHASSNAGTAIGSIVGGIMYSFWLGLPFFATGIAKLIGLGVSLFIDEPRIDSDKFSWKVFFSQTKKGFRHLFDKKLVGFSVLLLTFGIFHTAAYEIIDDLLVIDYGYTAGAIGILYAVAIFIAIPSSLMYEKISKKISSMHIIYIGIAVLALHYIFTPWIGVGLWTTLFLLRVLYSPLRENAISEIINKHTPSKIRATTLSTYSMLKIIPFVLMAGWLGAQIEGMGVREFAAIFFVVMLVLTLPQVVVLIIGKFELQRK